MGWSGGSELMLYIIDSLDEHVDDMDTLCECYEIDPVLDDILNEIYDDA